MLFEIGEDFFYSLNVWNYIASISDPRDKVKLVLEQLSVKLYGKLPIIKEIKTKKKVK